MPFWDYRTSSTFVCLFGWYGNDDGEDDTCGLSLPVWDCRTSSTCSRNTSSCRSRGRGRASRSWSCWTSAGVFYMFTIVQIANIASLTIRIFIIYASPRGRLCWCGSFHSYLQARPLHWLSPQRRWTWQERAFAHTKRLALSLSTKITNKKLTFLVPQIFRAQPQRNRPQDCNGLKYFQIIYPMFPKRDKIEMFPTI